MWRVTESMHSVTAMKRYWASAPRIYSGCGVPAANNELHRTAVSRNEAQSVIVFVVNKVLASIAPWAGGEPERYTLEWR